jgi:hypothetical protein
MPLVNPAPIVYQTLSNQIDAMSKDEDKTNKMSQEQKGLLSRSSKKVEKKSDMAEVDRVMHYMKLIRQQREEFKAND